MSTQTRELKEAILPLSEEKKHFHIDLISKVMRFETPLRQPTTPMKIYGFQMSPAIMSQWDPPKICFAKWKGIML